jgi:predicted RNase H-related nuclease YkuK (DUF458 family)
MGICRTWAGKKSQCLWRSHGDEASRLQSALMERNQRERERSLQLAKEIRPVVLGVRRASIALEMGREKKKKTQTTVMKVVETIVANDDATKKCVCVREIRY